MHRKTEGKTVNQDSILLIATVTLDRSLFTMEGDYWARFRFIGIRYGPAAFLLWILFVLVVFL